MTRMISNWFVALGFLWVMLASAGDYHISWC